MVIELSQTNRPAETRLKGDGSYTLTAGQELKIECPMEVLCESVPAGKVWSVFITIGIDETVA